ncbi:hypothetical protein A6V25_22780 [Nostoc sp. ATCC 53789]|nr:hypothetical protein A6V25_22780 [Nostoc sp. ATCC 53789]
MFAKLKNEKVTYTAKNSQHNVFRLSIISKRGRERYARQDKRIYLSQDSNAANAVKNTEENAQTPSKSSLTLSELQ